MIKNKYSHKLETKDKELIIRDYSLLNNFSTIAKKYNISIDSVKYVIENSNDNSIIESYRNEQKKNIIKRIWEKVEKALDAMTDEKIKTASLSQIVMMFGVSVEKALLMQGDPTAITRATYHSRKEMDMEIKAMLEQRDTRRISNEDMKKATDAKIEDAKD